MLTSIFILDEGTVPIPEGCKILVRVGFHLTWTQLSKRNKSSYCKILVRVGFHLTPDLNEARAETAKLTEMTAPGKRVVAEVYVPIVPEFILEAADLLMGTMEAEMDYETAIQGDENWFMEEIDYNPWASDPAVPPPAADWKQQYIEFATSFTEKLTAKVQASNNPFEVINYLDDLFKEMAFSHQPLDPGQLAQEIMAAAKDNAERRKAQQWVDLGL